ncbi:MAG TPA: DUF2087 domain-containing protein [Burkholderiaceae bacterium]|nr:DUF2087 domain-containing protein [Burkholderiaceae bacterium]
MTRTVIALNVPDLSAFARGLRRSLAEHLAQHAELPAHQSLLNHIARAAGHRNWQALHAQARPIGRATADTAAPAVLSAAAAKALGSFDSCGRMSRWPHKHSVQRLALWVLWMQFEGRRVYSEREVNAVLKAWHTWGDHVTLRRELINDRLLTRKSDGSQYRKLPARPSDEARALMAAWRARLSAAQRQAAATETPARGRNLRPLPRAVTR